MSPVPPIANVVVLCAGFGSRMQPLTLELPKPLLPVGEGHALARISHELQRNGLREAALNTHHLSEILSNNISNLPVTFKVSHEPRILGVAGGIRQAVERLGMAPPVISWNGDILLSAPPLKELAERAGESLCLLVAATSGTGSVGLGAGGTLVRVRGEHFGEELERADYVGVAALGPRALAALPREGCLIGDVCLPLLRRGIGIPTVLVKGPWWEVGSFQGYQQANLAWLSERGLESYCGSGCGIAPGVVMHQSIVGTRARVDGAGLLERCIVWPGAHARAPLRDCVVTPRQTVGLTPTSTQ